MIVHSVIFAMATTCPLFLSARTNKLLHNKMTSLRLKQATRILLAFFLCNLIFQITFADIRPASLFKDGMVLQQKTKVRIWGWSTPNATVTVKSSWSNHPQITRSDSQGKWQLLIKTPKCSFQ